MKCSFSCDSFEFEDVESKFERKIVDSLFEDM